VNARSTVALLRRLALATLLLVAAAAAGQDGSVQVVRKASFSPAAGAPTTAVELPHGWRNASPEAARATFVLQFAGPAAADVGVFIDGVTPAFDASVNGRRVYQSGPVGRPTLLRSWRGAPAFQIPRDVLRDGLNNIEFAFLVPGETGVVLGSVSIGPTDQIMALAYRDWLLVNLFPLVVAAVLGAVGLLALALWRGRRDYDLFFWLGLGASLWSLQNFLYQWPYPPLPSPHMSVLLIGLYVWYPLPLAVFFLRFAYVRSALFERTVIAAMLLVAPVLYAASAAGHFGTASLAVRAMTLVMVSIALLAVLRFAVRARDIKGGLLLVVGALCVGGGVFDYYNSIASPTLRQVWSVTYTGAVLVMLTAWMLLDRYQQAYSAYRDLNLQLEGRVRAANAELQLRLEQTEAAREQAEQASIAKSRFFAAASHDLRQPLHSLGLFTSALDEHLDSPQARATARNIRESITALESLFDSLLDLSRLDAGIVTVQPRNVALQALFDRLALDFHVEAVERDLRLRFVPTRAVVRTDPLLLERILINLVSNALRYTRRGGVVVGVRRRAGGAAIEVCDTGIGIPPDKQALVFEEFYQVDNPGRDRRLGLGLGLAIVKRLTELLGHQLRLRSRPGRGTCFGVEIPLADGPAEPIEEAPPMLDDDALLGVRVLVVDDDLMVREGTASLLRQWRAVPHTAGSGAEAEAAVRDGFAPDLLIVDLRLGEPSDGIDVAESLRRRLGRRVPALLVSGDTGAVELARVRSSGIPMMTKPVAPARLRAMLRDLARREP
jgi:signal transduction histidine kinase